jgi:anti-anti-sigma factor
VSLVNDTPANGTAAFEGPLELAMATDWPAREVCLVRLVGELDGVTAPRLARHLREQTAAGARDLVLDLTGVWFISAAGVTVIVRAFAERLGGHGGVHLTGVTGNRPVEKVLGLTGLREVLDVHDELGSLLARLTAG